MNSIEAQHELEQVTGDLFDEVLMPIAERMRANGKAPFPLAPDVSQLSYYVRRRRSAMTHDDFRSGSCADAGELAVRLAALWDTLGRVELSQHAARFAELAETAKRLRAASVPAAQLSPYVYAMF
ncbi:MAG: hypothetical protein ABIT83_14900 [Massilia sp.]